MESRSEATIDYNYTYYMVTIAKHQVKDYVDKSDILNVQHLMKLKISTLEFMGGGLEISPTYHQLHYHGIVRVPTRVSIYFKNNCSFDGFRVQWRKCYDTNRALDYCLKNAHNKYVEDQICYTNYFNHHSLFL